MRIEGQGADGRYRGGIASGSAGALALTTGVSATLIGAMMAVALLPPLVTFGLLLGGAHPALAMGALSLFLMNLICVNLAGMTTFLVQGIHPATWWEKDRAAKSAHCHRAVGGVVGGIGRHDPAVAERAEYECARPYRHREDAGCRRQGSASDG